MAKKVFKITETPFEEWPEFLTPFEVGALLRVDPKTVRSWANQGKIPFIRTLGGHRRFAKKDVRDLFMKED